MTTHNEEGKKFEILLNKHIVIAFSKQGQKSGRVLDSLHKSFQNSGFQLKSEGIKRELWFVYRSTHHL